MLPKTTENIEKPNIETTAGVLRNFRMLVNTSAAQREATSANMVPRRRSPSLKRISLEAGNRKLGLQINTIPEKKVFKNN